MNVFLGMIYSTETLRQETKDTELIPCIVIHQNNSSKKNQNGGKRKKWFICLAQILKHFFKKQKFIIRYKECMAWSAKSRYDS